MRPGFQDPDLAAGHGTLMLKATQCPLCKTFPPWGNMLADCPLNVKALEGKKFQGKCFIQISPPNVLSARAKCYVMSALINITQDSHSHIEKIIMSLHMWKDRAEVKSHG